MAKSFQDNSNLQLPPDYVEQYIYQYVGYVKKTQKGDLVGGCPICNEGSSWGKRARFHYTPDREGENATCKCFNCGWVSTSMRFIQTVSGLTYHEIKDECEDYDIIPMDYAKLIKQTVKEAFVSERLPQNSINLFDPVQVEFYKGHRIIQIALDYIKSRKLDVAINRPKTFYVSLDDYTHKNRLVIPYYSNGKIVWYQTRKLVEDDSEDYESPKYLSRVGAARSLFNIDNISMDIPYIFIFEGAIDAMFVQNATCVSGITEEGTYIFNDLQREQLARYPFHEHVYVIDSPEHDLAAKQKTEMLIKKGEKVFKWSKKFSDNFKDFNEIAVKTNKQKIPHEFIMKNLYKGGLESQVLNNLASLRL